MIHYFQKEIVLIEYYETATRKFNPGAERHSGSEEHGT